MTRRVLMLLSAALLPAVAPAQTGNVIGALVSPAGEPLAYGIVGVEGRERSQFTDDSGRFEFRGLPTGRHVLHVRRLGFLPRKLEVEVRAGAMDTIRVELTRVAVGLSRVDVRAYPLCTRPGPPQRERDSVLADVLEQIHLNAEQYRFLAKQYPFVATMVATRMNRMRSGDSVVLDRSAVHYTSAGEPYDPGNVIHHARGRDWYFNIPALGELANADFLRLHCWYYVGPEVIDTTTVLRMDLVASERLKGPDVNGSIYLDAKSFQVRRTVLHLSRRFEHKPEMVDMEVTTDFHEILPSIPIIAHVMSVQTMDAGLSVTVAATTEEQTLRDFRFKDRKPGDQRKP